MYVMNRYRNIYKDHSDDDCDTIDAPTTLLTGTDRNNQRDLTFFWFQK